MAVKTPPSLEGACDALPLRLGIAVSGGADSMALLGLVLAQQKTHKRDLVVLTVDHGLRRDSADEARMVHDYCAAHGVHHVTLKWGVEKPRSGVQQKARDARRALLVDACLEHGVTDLVLAHQAQDQLETFLQRLSRGAGLTGLRGIRLRTHYRGVTLHRPLLSYTRGALRSYCEMHNIPFVDDPSNADMQFERVRWRRIIDVLQAERADFIPQFLRSQKRLAKADDALAQLARQWITDHVTHDLNKMVMPRDELLRQPEALIVHILRQLMTTHKAYQVDLERLETWVAQLCSTAPTETALTLDQWWLRVAGHKVSLQKAPPRTARAQG